MIASPHSELSYPAVAPVPSPEITGEALDRLTRLAARFLAVPAAVISWEEQGRQVIVSSYGLSGAGDEGAEPACGSICERVAREASVLAISDCRSSGHPEAGGVGAYLGVPLAQD
ncbi:MAG: hypothetical protein K0Q72_1820, partial [Armatimonadetes bacterium]|nr:hypothetical protein [Armatimonadota bacterium]